MIQFWKKRASASSVADEGTAGRSTRFQLVADDAFIALGAWGKAFLNSPVYTKQIAPKNMINLPEQIAGWLRSAPGPSNPALDAYRQFVTKLVEKIFAKAKQDARSEPTEDWTSEFCRHFAAGLTTLIDLHLGPKVCSGEYPISLATPQAIFNPAASVATHKASSTTPAEQKRGTPMCMLTYLGDQREEAALAKFSGGRWVSA